VIVLSDGEPYDVDVHDPRYLVEDARQAVRMAAQLEVRIICLAVKPDHGSDARRIFGRAGVQRVRAIADVPQAFSRWMI
jgi:nitric oxide reductase activation protein